MNDTRGIRTWARLGRALRRWIVAATAFVVHLCYEAMPSDISSALRIRCARGLHPTEPKPGSSGTPACGARKDLFLAYPALTPSARKKAMAQAASKLGRIWVKAIREWSSMAT